MSRQWSGFDLAFSLAGSLLLLFILVPLLSAIFSSAPATLWQTLHDGEVLASIRLTFLAGMLSVVLGILTGTPLAYLLARRHFRGRELVQALVNLPVLIPHTAAGIALLLVFGRRGALGQWLAPLGITFTDNLAGIVVGMTFVSLPLLVSACREAFSLIEEEYELSALADGASQWQAFWYVTLPQAWRGIASGAVLMWARGVSEFGAVVILAYHPKTVPVLVYERFQGFGLEAAQSTAVLLILAALVAFVALNVMLRPRRSD